MPTAGLDFLDGPSRHRCASALFSSQATSRREHQQDSPQEGPLRQPLLPWRRKVARPCKADSWDFDERRLMQSLRVLTFNVSGENCSALAPRGFGLPAKYAAIAQLILEERPELLTLQEVFPNAAAPLAEALLLAGYEPCGSVKSHCGYTQLWAEARLQARQYSEAGPVAIARIPLPLAAQGGGAAGPAGDAEPGPLRYLYFAGCHLEPFADGAPFRLMQVEDALRAVPPRSRLILAGDCNMRNAENESVEALGLADAFQQLGRPQDANFSWNTRVNTYYGDDTRAYTARYDRVYMRGLSAAELRLVADKEQTPGRGDFLSDHFGLLARLEVLQGQPASPGQPDKEQPASPAGQKRGSGGLQERRRVRSCRRG